MDNFEKLSLGQIASLSHTITKDDIEKFVNLTGDDNKLHIDYEYASLTEFKRPVAHGMLGASFISTVIGTKLPGDGALWFSQTLEFIKPVRIGDTIVITATIIGKNVKSQSIELKTDIHNQYNQLVTTGIAKVKVLSPIYKKKIIKQMEEKVVLVLGASGGIGSSTAINLARNGFDLILHYHSNYDKVIKLKDEITSIGRECHIIQANLLDESSIRSMTQNILNLYSFITGFVNCTTTSIPNIKYHDIEWRYFQEHFEMNVKSSFLILKALMPLMEFNKYGKIVFITSLAVETPNTEWVHYITAKSALNGFSKALALELAPKGIRINMVSPSLTDTELVADIPQKSKLLVEARTPLRRLCSVEDIANSITFLMMPSSDFLTGETIRVNGGINML